ncbi:MAG: hypothetical protein ACK59M_18620 [Pseudomonadota bacterium]|jgi:hypothetical protein
MARTVTQLKKPTLARDAVLGFAEGAARGTAARTRSSAAGASKGEKSGLVPEGDVRLTANVRADLHMKLKMRAVQERTTVGELIEAWIESWKA